MSNERLLAINCGSSSTKLTLFQGLHPVKSLSCEPGPLVRLLQEHFAEDLPYLKAIGHRYVHGGERFYQPLRMTKELIPALQALNPLAPLHNPLCLQGVLDAMQWAPEVTQVAVFDTAFHHNMPWEAAHYALPESFKVRRYGFHGIAHQALWHAYSKQVSAQGRVITLQLGNGCSACAIHNGRSMDTSMGFTPAEGLVMGTRAGDIDWALIPYVSEQQGLSIDQVMQALNFQSGLLGLSGRSSSMKELLESKDPRSERAIELFCYRIVKYIGAYTAVLGGLDALIFSGGIGLHAPQIRKKVIERLRGFSLDGPVNEHLSDLPAGSLQKVSSPDSAVALFAASVDENSEIAKAVNSELGYKN